MPRVAFAPHVARHVSCPTEDVEGARVRDALEAYFARHPAVRSYVLDEQDALRKHVVVFVDGVQARDRTHLADATAETSEVYVMQALSGG